MDDTTCLIVGAGPVGMTLAHRLDRLGVPCVVVERRPDTTTHPSAHVVNARTLEIWRQAGFDMAAIRAAIEAGGARGASTISQQTVKNVVLWQGRSWPRKALEAALTPYGELVWPKRRILELYLNVAEMGEGVFGAEAAARHWFDVPASELTAEQAALLAAILPSPKRRSASEPGARVRRRAEAIADGAALIARDGRADCFEP